MNIQEQYLKTREIAKNALKLNSRKSLISGIAGGTGIGLSYLYLRQRDIKVYCDSRLSDKVEVATGDKSSFDWKKFWSYLKQHIVKLVGAVGAALAVAYLNISIPNLLGELVNKILEQFNEEQVLNII